MARSDEAASFFVAVYRAVQEVPPGKVTSYGHIARLIGTRESTSDLLTQGFALYSKASRTQRPRQVGVCLKHLSHDESETYNNTTVPWQRVINAKGVISPRSQPSGTRNQAAALRAEGVTVTRGGLGELSVDFAEFGWFPRSLPSEEGEAEDSDSAEGSE
ncbi:DNA binding methylated-DNA--cysteine S-methyltransferase [Xylariaceae sp. FL0016]|nr:DNA binding methylated-DNA--cysteine S-methyltransferase [Xylariaceae sp. FL0016]